jgi:glycine betaine/proline transport system substrate-binding protein
MFTKRKMGFKILLSVIALLLLLPLCLTGCAGEEAQPLKLADAGWDSIQVHNAIVDFIVQNGYGYPPSEIIPGSSPVILVGIAEGDIDIHMELWSENYGDIYTDYIASGEVIEVNLVFDDNYQGWLVPTYTIEGDAERGIEATAPGLKSVYDLAEYRELFKDLEDSSKGCFINSIPGLAQIQPSLPQWSPSTRKVRPG